MEKWQVEWTPIEAIKLNPKNRNKHPPEQIERLAKNFQSLGWVGNPIVVSTRSGLCAAGEGRYLAAKKCKMEVVPVHHKAFASEEEEYAFGVSDNALADWADLDMSAINADLPDLGPEIQIDLLGIKDFTLDYAESDKSKSKAKKTAKTCQNCGHPVG